MRTHRTSRLAQWCPSFALVLLGQLLRPAPWTSASPPPQPAGLEPAPAPGPQGLPLRTITASDGEDPTASGIIARINTARQQRQLPPLQPDGGLAVSAEVRVAELRAAFSHDRPESTLEALLDDAGVDWSIAAETLARVAAPTALAAVDEAYRSLIASASHRDILLSPAYSRIGVAISHVQGQWLFVELVAD